MSYEFLRQAVSECFAKRAKVCFDAKDADAATLARDGIVLVKEFLPVEDCDRYRQAIMAMIEARGGDASGEEFIQGARLIDRGQRFDTDHNMIDVFDIDQAMPELAWLRDSERIREIIQGACGERLEAANLNVYYNRGVRPRVLHVDNFTNLQFKAFIYLTDVADLEDGPYQYVKGSHLCSDKKILSYLDNFHNRRYATDMREFSYADAMPCLATRGTLVISDQNGVHGAHPQPEDRERLLLMMNFSATRIVAK